METEVRDRPAFANILVKMDTGESIIAESDAMASMSASIKMKTKLNGVLQMLFYVGSLVENLYLSMNLIQKHPSWY